MAVLELRRAGRREAVRWRLDTWLTVTYSLLALFLLAFWALVVYGVSQLF